MPKVGACLTREGKGGITISYIDINREYNHNILMSISSSENVVGRLILIKSSVFVSAGMFLSLVTLIHTKSTLDPNNIHLESFSVN